MLCLAQTLELWQELLHVLCELEADTAVRGVIWVSGLKRDVFTAGNNLKELHAPSTSRSRHRAFWIAQTTFLARLYRSPLVTVAAIKGDFPAACKHLCFRAFFIPFAKSFTFSDVMWWRIFSPLIVPGSSLFGEPPLVQYLSKINSKPTAAF